MDAVKISVFFSWCVNVFLEKSLLINEFFILLLHLNFSGIFGAPF